MAEYYERALKGFENVLGKTHPVTLGAVNNITVVYDTLKDYEKAIEMYQRALDGSIAQLGKDHIETQKCASNFSLCLVGNYTKNRDRRNLERFQAFMNLMGWIKNGKATAF